MPREVEKIKTTEETGPGSDSTTTSTHPAFGQISVSRISHSGSTRLYGSALITHPQTILFSIKRSERHHNLSMDWFFGRERLIEVEMSSSQFANMLTHMNLGDGVPCTIRSVAGRMVSDIPYDDEVETERIKSEFKKEIKSKAKDIEGHLTELDGILSKKSIGKKDREEIKWIAERMARFFNDHAPFVVDQFEEAAEKISVEAKKEVEAFVHTIAEKTGLEVLKKMTGQEQERLLTENVSTDGKSEGENA